MPYRNCMSAGCMHIYEVSWTPLLLYMTERNWNLCEPHLASLLRAMIHPARFVSSYYIVSLPNGWLAINCILMHIYVCSEAYFHWVRVYTFSDEWYIVGSTQSNCENYTQPNQTNQTYIEVFAIAVVWLRATSQHAGKKRCHRFQTLYFFFWHMQHPWWRVSISQTAACHIHSIVWAGKKK